VIRAIAPDAQQTLTFRGGSGYDSGVQMSEKAPAPTIAYLAQGNVRVKAGAAPPRTVDSAYGDSIREKQVRAQQ
jgi:hypothetical protein